MSSKPPGLKPSSSKSAGHVTKTKPFKPAVPKHSSSKASVVHVKEESDDGDSSDEELISEDDGVEDKGSLNPTGGDGLIFQEFEETERQVHEIINMPTNCSLFIKCVESSSILRYQDILPQIIDGKQFFIDGDSLLLFALTAKGLSLDKGGQTLHVVYLVEKFLLSFISRNLTFTVIFFEIWNVLWEYFPHFSVARAALKLHLLHNQKLFTVLSMRSMWEEDFSCLIEDVKPSFILMTTELPKFLTATSESNKNWMQFILSSQSAYCGSLRLDVVDIETIHSTAASLMATVHTHIHNFRGIKASIERLVKRMPVLQKTNEKIYELPVSNMRSSIIILAAARTLKNIYSADTVNVVKTVILSAAVLEFIPLKMRCFKNLSTLPLKVTKVLKKFQSEMSYLLKQICPDSPSIDFSLAGDLWQGKFIQAVFNTVGEVGIISCEDNLGNIIASRYEELLSLVNKQNCEKVVHPYPIENMCDTTSGHILGKDASTGNFESKLIPSSCKLTGMFTGALACNQLFYSSSSIKDFDPKDILHENRHWHNKQPLTDALQRIPDNATNAQKESNKRYAQNLRNTMARFNTIYGLSLEGRSSITSIVTSTSKPNERQKKQLDQPKSQSKGKLNKKERIIEANTKRIQEEKQRQIEDRMDNFFIKDFSSLILKTHFSAAIEKCDLELKHASDFPEVVLKVLFCKAKACFELWKSECCSKEPKRNLYGAKELFLVIREIFKMCQERSWLWQSLSRKQINKLSTWLHELGFKALCSMKGLPNPKRLIGNLEVGMNHVEFQLAHLRADLTRETGGVADSRAVGFIPDPWQVELFDIIDKKQSAVVIAPTSSGKTYASYYCMEQVIRESDDGVVVYVCPTKALVNQVFATIYARFKKSLPAGKTLLGVLTRDFRQNVTNCQILTTTPESLEILLMSPRCQTWARKIKYVIFDEVHCLVAQSGGLSWENCILLNRSPFLALSATISKPEEFSGWLQKVENFKREQAEQLGLRDRCLNSYKVSLILHLERHNHLIKSVMMDDGSINHVHPYSVLNRRSNNIPEHISLSPDEALELYVSMKKVLHSEEVSDLCVLKFFHELCPSGFLSMQSVRKFSETLRNILCKENVLKRGKVLDNLHTVDFDSIGTTEVHILKNIPAVLDSVKKNGLVPALGFSYNRSLVDALLVKLLKYLRSIDNFSEDEITDDESDTESRKSSTNKEFRRYREKGNATRKLGIMRGPTIFNSRGSLRGPGVRDEKLIGFIEHRLIKIGYRVLDDFPSLLRRGLGKHHGGMNNKERSAIEMLFRSRVLNLVFATGTLALGIHMPCKTVIVTGDSPYLNALEFHQMSGRAGRRGFDKEGNVIFYGLHKRKIEALMTGNLPSMVGNFPLNASLILRLLVLVADTTIETKVSQEATAESCARAYTLLENGLLYESQPGLKSNMKYYFSFVIQFLMRQNLLQSNGKPHVHATFITHLFYHEPSNFAFYFLLNTGVLEEMCDDHKGHITEESLRNLVSVLNFLFGRIPVTQRLDRIKKSNSVVLLPPLPPQVVKTLKKYNREVLYTFNHYFMCIASDLKQKFGEEKNLPLSQLNMQPDKELLSETLETGKVLPVLGSICSYSNVCSVFAGLSGNTDKDVSSALGDIHHVREDVNVKIVPTLELDFKCNAYILDFYKHGIAKAICLENGLRSGQDFAHLKDFLMVSKSIYVSLSEMLSPDAKLLKAMGQIVHNFESNFKKAYYAYEGR